MTQSVHRQERLISTVAEVRTILCFRVPEPELHERLPLEWRAVPYAEEAHAGANLRIPLTDQQMAFDADGKPRPTARFAPLIVPAIRDGMDVPAPMVIAVLTAHVGEGTNDPYSNTIWAKGEVRRCSTTSADAITSAEEAWSFEGRDGTRSPSRCDTFAARRLMAGVISRSIRVHGPSSTASIGSSMAKISS